VWPFAAAMCRTPFPLSGSIEVSNISASVVSTPLDFCWLIMLSISLKRSSFSPARAK
jgi:hypothetical protein